jgi:lipid-binding SYLF domain-containing protein
MRIARYQTALDPQPCGNLAVSRPRFNNNKEHMSIRKNSLLAVTASVALLGALNGNAAGPDTDTMVRASMKITAAETALRTRVDESAAAYFSIAKGAQGQVPASTLREARCIAVLPGVMTGALIVGGTHGSGLASCKNSDGSWTQPAPIAMRQGSIGLQAGAKTADLVLYFQSAEAVAALKRGNFSLGSDISAVAGTYDGKLDTSRAGVVAYSQAAGLFAGVSITESKLMKEEDEIKRFYGANIDYTAILDGRASPDKERYTEKLTKLFPS